MTKKCVPAARHQQILNWLDEEGSLSIKELQNRLAVSHMTIHRDLDLLAEQGLIKKVRGGAVVIQIQDEQRLDNRTCAMCGMHVTRRLEFKVIRKGKIPLTACCPHCGLMLVAGSSDTDSALARDYLYGHMVNVYQAHYVVASDIHLCCEPTVLCFAKAEDAAKFSRGFGGKVRSFQEVIAHLTDSHHPEHH